jgi:hypothetical protein
MGLQKTSCDFEFCMKLQKNFGRFQKTEKKFIKLQERSLCCLSLGNKQNEYITTSLQVRTTTCCSVGKCQRI